ncbi:MAG: hypothetical protein ABL986_10420 [Vicinamibacterales bacterium]
MTPLPTRVWLVTTLVITAAVVGTLGLPAPPLSRPTGLGILTLLFALRVAGQGLVQARRPTWLPPNGEWALTPYRVLLPVQLALIALMVWIDVDVALGRGRWAQLAVSPGNGMLWFSGIYAATMAIRYGWRMSRRADQRWFGGAIPIFFHWVLASYLLVLGGAHV